MKLLEPKRFIAFAVLSFAAFSCSEGEAPSDKKDDNGKKIKGEILDPNRSFNTTFDGKLFSVPSPIQTALLIRSTDVAYNEDLLNDNNKVNSYNTNTAKALNLGVYGADLGYVTLYEQNAKALRYINAVESLSNDLGISGAFDANFVKRFEANSTNQDSMLVILTDAFRKGDNFLKENERKNTSALILTGGWIESMFFAANLYKKSDNELILKRIGEQNQSLQTIIDILVNYNEDSKNDEILAQLKSLNELFKNVEIDYEYVEPTTDAEKKITTLKSKMQLTISDELTEQLIDKINEIRSFIVA